MNPTISPSFQPTMLIESATDLGEDALRNPGKYQGFMGISIGHKYFSKSTMESFFLWGSHMFKEFTVIVLDNPDRYNFMVFENLDLAGALAKARMIGDERTRAFEKVIRKIGVTNVKVISSKHYTTNILFQNILHATINYAKKNQKFKAELYELINNSIGGKIAQIEQERSLSPDETSCIRDLLAGYIIEEFASLLYFTENGYPIEVDPTKEFTIKKMIYEGHFSEFNNLLSLTRLGHIYAHPAGLTKSTY